MQNLAGNLAAKMLLRGPRHAQRAAMWLTRGTLALADKFASTPVPPLPDTWPAKMQELAASARVRAAYFQAHVDEGATSFLPDREFKDPEEANLDVYGMDTFTNVVVCFSAFGLAKVLLPVDEPLSTLAATGCLVLSVTLADRMLVVAQTKKMLHSSMAMWSAIAKDCEHVLARYHDTPGYLMGAKLRDEDVLDITVCMQAVQLVLAWDRDTFLHKKMYD